MDKNLSKFGQTPLSEFGQAPMQKEVKKMNDITLVNCSGADPGTEQTYVYWDRVRAFMSFTGMSLSTLARKSQTPESTLRKLLQGVTKDPRISTVQPVFKALELDANIALGLSPPRDYDTEISRENVPLTDALRQQLDSVRAERDAAQEKAQDLRLKYLETCEALSAAEATISVMQEAANKYTQQQTQLDKRADDNRNDFEKVRNTLYAERAEAKRLRIALTVMCFVAIVALGVAVYVMWDASHPGTGFFRA